MRTILSALVISCLALAAPMVHADEAKTATLAQSEKAPAKKSTKVDKKTSDGKPAPAQKAQPRRVKTVRRSSSSKTVTK